MSTYTIEALSRSGRRLKVSLQTESGADTIEAGTDGLYLAADEALTLHRDAPDADDVLLPASLSLKLLTATWHDDFFTRSETGISVKLERDGTLLFAGYVEPQAYSQPFNESLDEVELSCIDCLSALQYRKYKNVGRAGTDFATLRAAAATRTLADVMSEAIATAAEGLPDFTPEIVWDSSLQLSRTDTAATLLQQISVSEALFLGEEEEDCMSLQDVLTECLRYLGLRCVQVGARFYLFNPDTVAAGKAIAWYGLDGTAALTSPAEALAISAADAADCNTQLSLGETFSRVSVEADRTELNNPVPTPLDSDDLSPAAGARQLYMTVIEAGGDGDRAKRNFRHMVLGEEIDANYGAAAITDWYVRLKKNDNWTFAAWDGTARVADLYDTLKPDAEHQESVPRYLGGHVGAALVAFGKRERDVYKKKNTPTATLSLTDYLVISTSNAPSTAARWTIDQNALLGSAPVALYTGPKSNAIFSPADDDTTNYLVLTGSIVLCPRLPVTHYYPDYVGADADAAFTDTATQPYTEHDDGCLRTYRQWEAANPADNPTDAAAADYPALPPDTGHVPEQLPWPDLEVLASYNRVPCLRCMLVIGSKCCVEDRNDAGTALGTYSWQPFKERSECSSDSEYFRQSFSLGFRPEKGDKLVGHRFEIENNITLAMGLDTEGLALPITRADALSGQVRFSILGPENVAYHEEKACLTSADFYVYPTTLSGYSSLLSYVSAVMLSNFKIAFESDNGFFDLGEDNDLVYMSDTDEAFDNKRDALTVKLTTALTAAERASLGVKSGLFLSEPVVTATGLPLTEVYSPLADATAKPEELLVDALYRRLHLPSVTMEQTVSEAETDHGPFCLYSHPALAGKRFAPEGEERDLQADTLRITAREITES